MASQQACSYGVVRRTESIPAAAASSYWREKADHASSTSSPPDSRQLPCTDGQCATDYHAPTLGRRLDCRLFTHPRTELVHMILQGYSASFYPSRCTVERKPVYQEGHYTGATKGGVREGKGRLVWTNGDTYTGDFHNGLRHGQGQLETKRGIRYEGDWRISRRHGEGSQEWPNGERYNGGWIHDLPDGRGTWLRRGGRYAGDLSEGLRHGKGILKFRNGAEYDGQWIRGRMHGYGSYLWPDARIYKGSWEAGLRHGEGTLSFSSGERYTGQWKEGRKHGQGVWRWSNGRTRRGEWHNDQLVGWTGAEVFGDQPARLLIAAGDENGKEAAGAGGRRGAKKSPKRGPGKAVTAGGAGTERSP